jgi:hypothetical protein
MQAHITGYENTRACLYVGQFLTNVTVLSPHLPGGNRQGYRSSERVSIPGSGFCLRHCIQICSGAHPASCPWGETGHSPQSSAEVKNKWSLTSTPPYIFKARCCSAANMLWWGNMFTIHCFAGSYVTVSCAVSALICRSLAVSDTDGECCNLPLICSFCCLIVRRKWLRKKRKNSSDVKRNCSDITVWEMLTYWPRLLSVQFLKN